MNVDARWLRAVAVAGVLAAGGLGVEAQPSVGSGDASASLAAGHSAEVERVLESVRGALVLQPGVALVEASGTADFRGSTVPMTVGFDRAGSFRVELEGPLPMVMGYDGDRAWERDWNDTPRILPLGEHDATLLATWTVTGFWADAASGLRFAGLEDEGAGDGGTVTLSFAMPGTPITGTVKIDAGTHLPVRFEWTNGSDTTVQDLSNFAVVGGVMLPGVVAQTGTNADAMTMRIDGAVTAAEDDAGAAGRLASFRPDLSPGGGTTFDPAQPARVEVRRAPTGHLLVHPLVGGEDLGWFIFDTGAGVNVLSIPVAEEAGLAAFGSVPARGVAGTADAHFYRASSLSLGPITIANPVFVGIDLAFLDQYMGVRVAGVLGYEFLARTVVEFDLSGAAIGLFDPATYGAQPGSAPRDWMELVLYNRHPCVPATFEGHEGVFNLDTGAAQMSVTLHADATERLGLLEGRETVPTLMGGVGGTVQARAGRLEWFEVGGHRRESVAANFATQRVGAYADPYLAGSIGGQLMAPFVLVMDYANARIAFVPRDVEGE